MGLSIDISEAQIQNAVAIAIAESFEPAKRDALLRDILRAHMSLREGTYDKETLLSKRVGTLVRQIALTKIESLIEEMRSEIEDIVAERFGDSFKASVCDKLKRAIANRAVANISIGVEWDDE